MPEDNKKAKPRVVIDTNVYVSGLNFQGRPREVLNLFWRGEMVVYISPFILQELQETLGQDFGWSKENIGQAIERIKTKAKQIEPHITVSVIKAKDDDNRILECAIEAQVQYLISGDKQHILPLKEYRGIKILSPAEFLAWRTNAIGQS